MRKISKMSVNIHDKTQLETIIDYNFSSKYEGKVLNNKQKYEVDVYFFFPPQMNITKSSYSKDDFYEDLRPLLRLKEPSYHFVPSGKEGEEKKSPFVSLLEEIEKIVQGKKPLKNKSLINDFSLLACSLSSYIKKQERGIIKDLKYVGRKISNDFEKSQTIHKNISSRLKEMYLVFRRWQKLFDQIEGLDHHMFQDLIKEMRLLDENLLNIFYRTIAKVFYNYEKYTLVAGAVFYDGLQLRLKAWLRVLQHSQKVKPYFILTHESTRKEKENHSMRLSYLKKRMWKILYLQVKDKASFFQKRQIAYMTAAGFAAIWALIANLMIWHNLNFRGYNSLFNYSDGVLGFSSSLLVLAFICAYILKDRIKDLGRDKLQGGLFKDIPDSTEQIWYQNSSSKKKTAIGTIYESQQMFDNVKSIPSEIRQYRSSRLQGRFIAQEDVIHYHKKILLNKRQIKNLGKDLTAIRDIMRLSIKRYITRLDDPEEKNYLLSANGSMQATTLPKVYYIDMVIKSSQKSTSNIVEDVVFDCRRVLLNKEGLVRVTDS